jgi:Flp pilus assembly protein TadD
VDPSAAVISPADLLRGEPLTGGVELPPVPDADVLGLDADMRRFVAENVSLRSPRDRRLRQLLEAVIGEDRLGVDYNDRTYTASEAFRLREANCLSFTNMFVALARQAGIVVSYQEVDVPPDWSRSGDTLVLNRHIDALVTGSGGRDQVVDFNIKDFRTSYDRRVVSDARAMAHYYSNIGVERMQAKDTAGALRYFRKAVTQDAGFTPAWINLGALFLRAGHADWARAAWWHALEIDAGELVALSNLERLERDQGRLEAANELQQRIGRHRLQNPYYRFFLAQSAFDEQDYAAAIGHLKIAVRLKKNEDRFLALLGLSYLRQGDVELAESWLARAEAAAGDDEQQRDYHSKLEMLKRIGAG